MPEYHVGCGLFAIYAGTLNKNGDKWVNKSEVTDEAMKAVAQFLIEHELAMKFEYDDVKYMLSVRKEV